MPKLVLQRNFEAPSRDKNNATVKITLLMDCRRGEGRQRTATAAPPWHTSWEGDGGRGRAGARLQPCLVRHVRQEVLAQLPSRTDTRVPMEMTGQQMAGHDSLAQPTVQLIRRAEARPLTQAELLRLMSLLTTQRIISNGLGQLRFDELWPTYWSRVPKLPQIRSRAALPPPPHPSDEDLDLEEDELALGEPDEPCSAVVPGPAPTPVHPAPLPDAPLGQTPGAPMLPDVGTLFQSVRVHRKPDGGIRLEAPPEAAASLLAVLDGMAKLLGQAARAG
jgi:hypothetical protein